MEGTDEYTFQHAGLVIALAAASDDGSLDVHTNGPCVNADGSLTTPTAAS